MTTTNPKRQKVEDDNNPQQKDQPKLKLIYFDLKGKGEPIRLYCAYAGLELEDHRFESRDEFAKLKESGKLPFGQVPLLEVTTQDNGNELNTSCLVQTASILRYLSTIAGQYPTNDPILAAKIDAVLEQETDAYTGYMVASYTTRYGIALDETAQKEAFQAVSNEVLPRHLGSIERLLQASDSGWIAGTKEPSIADFVWYGKFEGLMESKKLSGPVTTLQDFPACKTFVEKFRALEAIREYLDKRDKPNASA